MGMVNVHDTLHERIRRLILETGGTIGKFAHQALEKAVSAAETKLARQKAKLAK